MRGLLLAAVVAIAASARADTSLDARAMPRTPFGPACDAALAAAQAKFRDGWRDIDFHVRGQGIVGAFRWSDMCGVFGDYTLELARDLRPPARWRWSERRDESGVHRRGVVRAGGLRATFILEADDPSDLGDAFVDAFRPAVDVCVATSAAR